MMFPEQSPQHKVDKDDSPLHDACRKGNLTQVRWILSQGLVDINSREGSHGKTPLMVAAQEGHCRIFSFLIGKGANKSYVDNDGKNIFHWACKGGHVDVVECVLPQYGVNINDKYMTPLVQAAFWGHRDVSEFLLCMGADVSQTDPNRESVLHWACRGGQLDMVKYLLSLCSVDINSRGKGGRTPLMAAAMRGRTDIGLLLVNMGANLSQVDDVGNNVMHWACKYGQLDLLKGILSRGSVDINSRGVHGNTPLMNAVFCGNRKVVDLLVSQGGLTHLMNNKGENILHLASLSGCRELVKHILSQNMTDINARNKDGKTAAMITKGTNVRVHKFLVSQDCPCIMTQ
ncbi:ankyrin repeat, PH and SEC7 domain containing protein secG-like [Haliotis asinina]|uniref:ankyrin repeat, PH and SEC7 domain containing protein secG-like n=1 Tax=Haliotis asinina TaxID=109174 RepID=UPI003531DEFC